MRVVKEWVDALPLREQSTLLLSLRGPDGCSKEGQAKVLIRELRFVVLQPAFPKDLFPKKTDDVFMGTQTGYCDWTAAAAFFADHDAYPHHWLMHFIHAAEIVGQHHPDTATRDFWWRFYAAACESFHMPVENYDELASRLADPLWIADVDARTRTGTPTESLTASPNEETHESCSPDGDGRERVPSPATTSSTLVGSLSPDRNAAIRDVAAGDDHDRVSLLARNDATAGAGSEPADSHQLTPALARPPRGDAQP